MWDRYVCRIEHPEVRSVGFPLEGFFLFTMPLLLLLRDLTLVCCIYPTRVRGEEENRLVKVLMILIPRLFFVLLFFSF